MDSIHISWLGIIESKLTATFSNCMYTFTRVYSTFEVQKGSALLFDILTS